MTCMIMNRFSNSLTRLMHALCDLLHATDADGLEKKPSSSVHALLQQYLAGWSAAESDDILHPGMPTIDKLHV